MAWARKSRYLICFYCGTKTQAKYDGRIREFGCKSCGSTNYLDQNGDIADPPTATENEAPAARYTVSPPPSTSPDSIWCATCLKNQRLFTASLAQYLPDDPSHPEYAELERNYYRFRKGLEKRYPQMCPDCAKKAEDRIRQAGYVAKTDHLRRMMDRTRGRIATRSSTPLDWAATTGRFLWWAGLVLQFLWHLSLVARLLDLTGHGMHDPDDQGWVATLLQGLKRFADYLPDPDRLIKASITTSVLSAWWNPHFVQVNRGFTRHLLGLTQWYSFQGLIVFFRSIFRRVLEMDGGMSQTPEAQIGAHLAMAGLMSLIYACASRSIKVDTTPLFKTTAMPPLQAEASQTHDVHESQEPFASSLSHAINHIDSPPRSASTQTSTWNLPIAAPRGIPTMPTVNPLPQRHAARPAKGQYSLGSLRLSDPAVPEPPAPALPAANAGYSDEMDWAPTASQTSSHRAFNEPAAPFGAPERRSFGESPTQPNTKPFWFPVPAAPVNPAQRLRNPAPSPIVQASPVIKKENLFGARIVERKREVEDEGVMFKQPKFFAPERDADEANSLADLLNQSFSLSQEHGDEDDYEDEPKQSVGTVPGPTLEDVRADLRSIASTRATALSILLGTWILVSAIPFIYHSQGQLAVLCLAGVIGLHATGDENRPGAARSRGAPGVLAYAESAMGILEISTLCWVSTETWKGEAEMGIHGGLVLVAMLGHQLWNAVR
jgi:hypothetical protein